MWGTNMTYTRIYYGYTNDLFKVQNIKQYFEYGQSVY